MPNYRLIDLNIRHEYDMRISGRIFYEFRFFNTEALTQHDVYTQAQLYSKNLLVENSAMISVLLKLVIQAFLKKTSKYTHFTYKDYWRYYMNQQT